MTIGCALGAIGLIGVYWPRKRTGPQQDRPPTRPQPPQSTPTHIQRAPPSNHPEPSIPLQTFNPSLQQEALDVRDKVTQKPAKKDTLDTLKPLFDTLPADQMYRPSDAVLGKEHTLEIPFSTVVVDVSGLELRGELLENLPKHVTGLKLDGCDLRIDATTADGEYIITRGALSMLPAHITEVSVRGCILIASINEISPHIRKIDVTGSRMSTDDRRLLGLRKSLDIIGLSVRHPWGKLQDVTRQRCASIRYQQDSGRPPGAAAGGSRFKIAEQAIVEDYGARIPLAEILEAPANSGVMIAMPGPAMHRRAHIDFDDNHPFIRVLQKQDVGLLVRLTNQSEVNYWDTSYWSTLENKPQEWTYSCWPDHSAVPLEDFVELVRTFEQMSAPHLKVGRKVAVHCKAGVGRTGTLLAGYLVKKRVDAGLPADVPNTVATLRTYRQGLVQDRAQYDLLLQYETYLTAQ